VPSKAHNAVPRSHSQVVGCELQGGLRGSKRANAVMLSGSPGNLDSYAVGNVDEDWP